MKKEDRILVGFVGILIFCIVFHVSILWALGAGYVLFYLFAKGKGYKSQEILRMSLKGILRIKNILTIFFLIGLLTALWRGAGTIAMILSVSTRMIVPSVFLCMVFLLCSLVSVLMGSSFGTVATMGIICMTMAKSIGIPVAYTGGAILGGIFVGDRCSPVSSSANLVSSLTKTNIYDNIKGMLKTSWIPLILTCLIYLILGSSMKIQGEIIDVTGLFQKEFSLHWITIVPAAIIILLSLFRINVKITMLVSILAAGGLCVFWQGISVLELIRLAAFGYQSKHTELSYMIDGGGIVSMMRVSAIVCLSSSYMGIFDETGLLLGVKKHIEKLSKKITPFGATFISAIFTNAVACNQTLSIMLTATLCDSSQPDSHQFAIDLENTAVLIAPLIPWSIASEVPLSSIGAPTISIVFAFYLYMVPLCQILEKVLRNLVRIKRNRGGEKTRAGIIH